MSATPERAFDAVLFDWCGTLVEYPTLEDRIRSVLEHMGRADDDDSVAEVAAAIVSAQQHPAAVESDEHCDLSAENHRETKLLICELAGLDSQFADAFERSFGDVDTYSTYPEVVDVITALTNAGVKVAIVSDFHVDLRPHLTSLGLFDAISGFALSYELGATKPDPAVFRSALAMVGVAPQRCLMVGDNPKPDTGAAALGIATLILPLRRAPRPRLLERVLSLVLSDS